MSDNVLMPFELMMEIYILLGKVHDGVTLKYVYDGRPELTAGDFETIKRYEEFVCKKVNSAANRANYLKDKERNGYVLVKGRDGS